VFSFTFMKTAVSKLELDGKAIGESPRALKHLLWEIQRFGHQIYVFYAQLSKHGTAFPAPSLMQGDERTSIDHPKKSSHNAAGSNWLSFSHHLFSQLAFLLGKFGQK
jgi:hypothetical protein